MHEGGHDRAGDPRTGQAEAESRGRQDRGLKASCSGMSGAQQVVRGHPGVHREAAGTANRQSLQSLRCLLSRLSGFSPGSKAHFCLNPSGSKHKAKIGDRGQEKVTSLHMVSF